MVNLYNLTERSFDKVSLKKLAKKVLKEENTKRGNVDIILVDRKKIKELNSKYRDEDKETDVLSFLEKETRGDFVDPSNEKLGEIVICPEVAKDLKRVLVHGLLHLLGYNHQEKEEAEIMEKKNKKYL